MGAKRCEPVRQCLLQFVQERRNLNLDHCVYCFRRKREEINAGNGRPGIDLGHVLGKSRGALFQINVRTRLFNRSGETEEIYGSAIAGIRELGKAVADEQLRSIEADTRTKCNQRALFRKRKPAQAAQDLARI